MLAETNSKEANTWGGLNVQLSLDVAELRQQMVLRRNLKRGRPTRSQPSLSSGHMRADVADELGFVVDAATLQCRMEAGEFAVYSNGELPSQPVSKASHMHHLP